MIKNVFSARAGWVLAAILSAASLARPCTIAVVSGKATRDGRPLLWKNRDVDEQDNLVRFFRGARRAFLGLIDAGSPEEVYSGINEAGLALVNAVAEDMEGTSMTQNGEFIKRVLDECATVDDIDALLRATNGARRTKANFGAIDASGRAAVFEAGNATFTRYDADQSPLGFIVRTNFALSGTIAGKGGGYVRFNRASDLLARAAEEKALDHRFLLESAARDLVNEAIDPYPLPYKGSQNNHAPGYVDTSNSINRYLTASCTVFHGVRPGEDPRLATMWCILGEPVCGVSLPLWIGAGSVPVELGGTFTAPLREAVKLKENRCYSDPQSAKYLNTVELVDDGGRGLTEFIRRIEALIFPAAEAALSKWRRLGIDPDKALRLQEGLASWAFRRYVAEVDR